jgi:hypothetical protein
MLLGGSDIGAMGCLGWKQWCRCDKLNKAGCFETRYAWTNWDKVILIDPRDHTRAFEI